MNREGYTSKREAKMALMQHGCRPAFSSPGRPQLWIGPEAGIPAARRPRLAD